MSSIEFKQGSIIAHVNFPIEYPKHLQKTIRGIHSVLVLHDDDLPNDTVIVSPISSLYDKYGKKKDLKSYHLPLLKSDYPKLKNDSYVKLDQIMTFTRHKLDGGRVICQLSEEDLASCHLKLIESLQMHDTIHELIHNQLKKLVKETLEEYLRDQFSSQREIPSE